MSLFRCLCLLMYLGGCASSGEGAPAAPVEASSPEPPRLIRHDDRWLVTGLEPRTTRALKRGSLLVALGSVIPGTDERPPVATLVVSETLGKQAVAVVEHCQNGSALQPKQPVDVLRLEGDVTIGACLARVLEVSKGPRGRTRLTLSVGAGQGVRPGDGYEILGRPVLVRGFHANPLGNAESAYCVVPLEVDLIQANVSACDVSERGTAELRNGYAVRVGRGPS